MFISDPGVGPVDDAGCHVQIPSTTPLDDLVFEDNDECDSMQRQHLPTMSDMLIAFPSQKGPRKKTILIHSLIFSFQVLPHFESHMLEVGI